MVELYAVIALLICLAIVSRYHGLINLIDPVSYFTLGNVILGFVGIFYRGNYRLSAYISDEAVFILINGLLCFTVGVLIANKILHRIPATRSALIFRRDAEHAKIPFYIIYFVGIVFSIAYALKTGGILWASAGFDDARIVQRQGFGWLVLLGISFVTVGVLSLVIIFIASKKSLLMPLLLVGSGAIFLLLPGNRAPALELLVASSFFYCFFRWGKVPVVVFITGLLFAAIALAFLGLIRSGDVGDVQLAMLQAIWRPYVNLYNFQTVFDAFPLYLPYQLGGSFLTDLSVLAPGYQPNFGLWIKEQLNMNFAGGSVTVGFAGEMYANFGHVGVYVGYFLFAFLLVWISKKLRNLTSSSWLLLRYVVAMTAKGIAVSGVVSPILYVAMPFLFAFGVGRLLVKASKK